MRRTLLIPVLVLGLLAAGCGGSSSDNGAEATDRGGGHEHDGARAAATSPSRRRARTGVRPHRPSASTPRRRMTSSSRRTAARSRSGSTSAKAPATAASLVSLAKSGFYDNTIFHRIVPGVRDPGRRPDPVGLGRARLHDGRRTTPGRELHEGRGRDGEVGDRAGRNLGQPVLRRHGRRYRRCRPTTPSSATSRAASTSSSGSASSAIRPRSSRRGPW